MADTKISALPASTTPLAGTEVLPIVQSSVTKQVSVANLTAGRAISATELTLTTGSVIVASGQGIDFSATSHPAGMTSELLNDYEEGTWTPSLGGTTTYNSRTGNYIKIGNLVYARFNLNILLLLTGSTTTVSGLPFTPAAIRMAGSMAYWAGLATNVLYLGIYADVYTNISFISQTAAGANVTDGPAIFGNGTVMQAMVVYYI